MLGASAISAAIFGSRSGGSRPGFRCAGCQAGNRAGGDAGTRGVDGRHSRIPAPGTRCRRKRDAGAITCPQKEVSRLMPMPDKISVLLVDDHTLVRRGFRRILEDEPDITVAGEAGDGLEAVKLADELHPKVIVMDCAMPGMNGLDATREILDKNPQALVLMLSMHPEETLVRQALDAGARGYDLKHAVDLEFGAAIRRVVNGETVLDSQLKRPEPLRGSRQAGLTPREL